MKKRLRVLAVVCIILASGLATSSNIFSNEHIRNVDLVRLVAFGMTLGVLLTTIISLVKGSNKTQP